MAEKHRISTTEKLQKDGFGVFHFKNGYEKEISLHHHDCYEVYLLLSGNITYLIEGKQYQLHGGDCMLIAPGILHEPIIQQPKNAAENKYERFVLRMEKAFLNAAELKDFPLSGIFEHEPIHLQKDILQTLQTLFSLLKEQETLSGFGAFEIKTGYVRQILIFLCRSIQRADIRNRPESNPLMDRVLQYIGAHLTQELSTEQLAEKFFVNKFYLLREFKKYVGTTPHHYIIKKRLILAEKLLLEGMQVKLLYTQCGFSDYCNFFRCFKKEYGQTPRQFYEAKHTVKN